MGEFLLNAIRFVLAVLLSPAMLASVVAFKDYFADFPPNMQDFIYWGALAYLLIYIFVYRFLVLYEFGQRIICEVFKFAAPLNRMVSHLIPFYLTLIFLLFYVAIAFFKTVNYDHYFLFFGGFAFAMHLILVAQELQEQESSAIKPSYLLWMNVVVIFNFFLMVLLLNMVSQKFTFSDYFERFLQYARDYYEWILHKMMYFK